MNIDKIVNNTSGTPKALVLSLFSGLAVFGLPATIAAAEEMTWDGGVFQAVQTAPVIFATADEENPAYAGAYSQHALFFDADGAFVHWSQIELTFQAFGAVEGVTWQYAGTFTFPDQSKLFIRGGGTTSADGIIGTIEAVGGTDQWANASGSGGVLCLNPPDDPEGFPILNRCTFPGFVVDYAIDRDSAVLDPALHFGRLIDGLVTVNSGALRTSTTALNYGQSMAASAGTRATASVALDNHVDEMATVAFWQSPSARSNHADEMATVGFWQSTSPEAKQIDDMATVAFWQSPPAVRTTNPFTRVATPGL